jgi:hypothetical protein
MLMLTGRLPYMRFTDTCCLQPGVVLFVLLHPVWPAVIHYTACSTCQPVDTVPACCDILTCRLSAGLGWQPCCYCAADVALHIVTYCMFIFLIV